MVHVILKDINRKWNVYSFIQSTDIISNNYNYYTTCDFMNFDQIYYTK